MRELSRFLPILVGLALGYLLFSRPEWLSPLGPWRVVAVAAIFAVVLLGFVAWLISSNLPADPPLEGADERELSGELKGLCARLESLGFQRVGTPLKVGLTPPAFMVVFVNEAERTYATAFRTTTVPSKTGFDCVSILEGDRGGLTTGADPGGAAIPAARGSLRQVFPGATVEQVVKRHLQGLQYLASRGLSAKPVSAATFRPDFAMSFRRQREAFVANPLLGAVLTLWRSVTGLTPHRGAIAHQAVARATIEQLKSRVW